MLEEVGLKLPNHKVRDIVEDVKSRGDTDGESMTREVFEKVINIVYQHCCCIAKRGPKLKLKPCLGLASLIFNSDCHPPTRTESISISAISQRIELKFCMIVL